MRTLNKRISVGVCGYVWAHQTYEMIRDKKIVDYVDMFEYTEREALFIDQYDYFIITDFGKEIVFDSDLSHLVKLNQMREIIATRSMRTTLIANCDDIDVCTSIREACCRVIRVENLFSKTLVKSFTEVLEKELSDKRCLDEQRILSAVA